MMNCAAIRSALPGIASAAIISISPLLITASAQSMNSPQASASAVPLTVNVPGVNRGGSLDPTTIVTASPAPAPRVSDRLGWPTDVRSMTSAYGPRLDPITFKPAFHTGSDFATACGSPIYAAADGVVTSQGAAGDYGYRIVVKHEQSEAKELLTTYSHLSAIKVTDGQKVKKGDVIADMGTTGYSTGCHLHFEVILDGWFTNPWTWLTGETTNDPKVKVGSVMPVASITTPSASPTTGSPSAHTKTSTPTVVEPIPAVTSIPILIEPTPSPTPTPENISASETLSPSPEATPVESLPTPTPTSCVPRPTVSATPDPTPTPTPSSKTPSTTPSPTPIYCPS
ncbi:MAG: M23 family metallopeptidase [Propionibacteriaceae bacterium]